MSAERSDFPFRPVFAGFILILISVICLTTGCSTSSPPVPADIISISEADAASAGSMALYMQGVLYENATNASLDKAASAYANALRLCPENKNALASLVNILSRQKRFDDTYTVLNTYLKNFPESSDLQIYAAGIAEHLEKPEKAAFFYHQALKNNPTNATLAQAAIKYDFISGNDNKATETLKSFACRLDKTAALELALTTIAELCRQGENTNPAQALKCSRTALEFASDNREISRILMLQAYCQLETAQTNTAVRTFKKAFRSNPQDYLPLAYLGNIYASDPEMLQSLETCSEKNNSDTPPAQLILGHAYNAMGRQKKAAAVFQNYYNRRMRQGFFADKKFYLVLGSTYEKLKDYEKIDRLFKDAIAAFPDDPAILNFAAYLWAERKMNLEKALSYINRVIRQCPNNPAYIDTKAWILHKCGRNYEALQLLLKACALDNNEPVILDHTGDVLYTVGNDIMALDFWKKSYIVEPRKSVADKLAEHDEPVPK
ncbi:MAG: tetratricopeptide repeat protein [Kiritimatiellia bacterium]